MMKIKKKYVVAAFDKPRKKGDEPSAWVMSYTEAHHNPDSHCYHDEYTILNTNRHAAIEMDHADARIMLRATRKNKGCVSVIQPA